MRNTDGLVHSIVRGIHLAQCAVTQASRLRYVFSARQILMPRVEQFVRLGEAVLRCERAINGEAIIDVLTIVNGRHLDLVDGCVNVVDGYLIFMLYRGPGPVIGKVVPCGAKIA